jgi:predicted MPP superfamily phosphohydrolase
MGVLFLFCSWSLALDLYRIVIKTGEMFLHRDLAAFRPSPHLRFLIPCVFSLVTAVYGYYEALGIRTEKITLQTTKLPDSVERLRIVQISDVHLGLIVRGERLGRILRVVSQAKPDILVSTGDLVDGQINGLPGLAEMLQAIKPRFGKYAIPGNHEYYAGFRQAEDFTIRSGFTMLRGKSISIDGLITIAGIDDPAGVYFHNEDGISEKELLSGTARKQFTLLLKHRPFINKEYLGLFDLQLSGHVHKGQIFPFGLLTKLYYPVHAGFSGFGQNSHLYVSRGTGTWGPPIRFLSPPEVTVIDLVRHPRSIME